MEQYYPTKIKQLEKAIELLLPIEEYELCHQIKGIIEGMRGEHERISEDDIEEELDMTEW
jgi:uncharacterized protein YeeX (DUF496 family)